VAKSFGAHPHNVASESTKRWRISQKSPIFGRKARRVGRGQPLAKTLRSAPGTRGRRAGARTGPAFRRSPGHDRAPRLRASHDARKTSPPSTTAGRDNSCNGYQSSRLRRPRRPRCSAPDQERQFDADKRSKRNAGRQMLVVPAPCDGGHRGDQHHGPER